MICPVCGKEQQKGKFCVYCGSKIEHEETENKESKNKIRTYYEILEITQDASEEVIKASYKALVKKLHPDNMHNPEDYNKSILEINEAYAVLSDPQKRKEYDKKLEESGYYFAESVGKEESEANRNSFEDDTDIKEQLVITVLLGVAFVLFMRFDMPGWIINISGVCFAYFLALATTKIVVVILNGKVKKKYVNGINDDDENAILGLFVSVYIKVLFDYLMIHNWLYKVCLFFLVIYIVWCIKILYDYFLKSN